MELFALKGRNNVDNTELSIELDYETPSDRNPAALSLLYVEDDAIARQITCKLISAGFPDFVILQAENGHDGLGIFKKHRPDIVVTDINMPVMNGIQMSKEIMSIAPNSCIIAVTARSDKRCIEEIYEIGIAHCEIKPLDHKRLFEAIKTYSARIIQN